MSRDRLEAALRLARPERWKVLMGTVEEEFVRNNMDAWIAEGIAEGRTEGKAETFLRQAGLRFGGVPEALAAEVGAADEKTLDRLLEALLTAGTLEAVFAPRSPH